LETLRQRGWCRLLLLLPLISGCSPLLALEPRGPGAAAIAGLWWPLFWVAAIVCVLVPLLLLYALSRRSQPWSVRQSTGFVLLGGGVLPTLVLVGVLFLTMNSLAAFEALPGQAERVTVTGHMFWWEIAYPEHGIVTANELHIPVGVPVAVSLHSADVIHSLWVPQLQGKLEMIPGRENELILEADTAGEYLGKCAEFCGVQHANMELLVIAQAPEDYAAWVERQRRDATQPTDPVALEGMQVFLGSACVYCHAVRGTPASGRLGPDLTHLASRRTLGARMLENNRGNLAGWIVNAQAIKPGNAMPPMHMEPEPLLALLAYLEGLE
jgi:cytochrome c oxidase subunit II